MRGHEAAQAPSGPRALVVQIDQRTAETRYYERSPLNRCELRRDLADVYSAMKRYNDRSGSPVRRLDVLVVDLDLQPWSWLATEQSRQSPEADCERALHEDIRDSNARWGVRTVTMQPFEVAPEFEALRARWIADNAGKVATGRAAIPVNYGLVIKQYCAPDMLAATAYEVWSQKWPAARRPVNTCIAEARARAGKDEEAGSATQIIDPRQYRAGVVALALVAEPGSKERAGLLDAVLSGDARPARGDTDGWQAVFFGAGFGDADLFVTPLGDLYGVEIHAAGFLSFIAPLHEGLHVFELVIDVAFGFIFGMVIAGFWSAYYHRRLSESPARRLTAPMMLIFLGLSVAGVTVALLFVSYSLLLNFGLWASPVSMAVGMLIESFVSGSTLQGVHVANALQGTGRPARRSLAEGARKFFGGDIVHFWRKRDYSAVRWLAIRLLLWIAVVSWAIVQKLAGS